MKKDMERSFISLQRRHTVSPLLAAAAVALTLSSCKGHTDMRWDPSQHLINTYVRPQGAVVTVEGTKALIEFQGERITDGPDFERLAADNHDMDFGRVIKPPLHELALTDSMAGMSVVTVEDFNAAHPAGSDVSDLVTCRFVSYEALLAHSYYKDIPVDSVIDTGAYLRAWETGWPRGLAVELWSGSVREVNCSNTRLTHPVYVLLFAASPATRGTHDFIVTMRFTGGTLTRPLRMDFE